MRIAIKMILGSIMALTLGLGAASPILIPNLALTASVQIEVDVVYAYFSVQNFTSNITGLWRNYSSPLEKDQHIITYLFILNVTNPTNEMLVLGEFTVYATPRIDVTPGPKGELSIAQTNPIVVGFIDLSRYYPSWSHYWSPNATRLIALSGIIENWDIQAYNNLQEGNIYLFGQVEGRILGGGRAYGYGLKHVQLQKIGNEYLYNDLLNENQILRLSHIGIDAFIETRR